MISNLVVGTAPVEWGDAIAVVGGAAVAVFVGGWAIAALLAPFEARLEHGDRSGTSLARAGLYIGWLERALLYTFLVAGAAGAAAAVVALKSIARFPSFKEERFAEYYLIGTLASVLVATLAAVAVRAMLGADALLK